MSTPAEYQSILKAVCATPPFKRLVAVLRAEDHEEHLPPSGSTRRDIATKFIKSELGRIFNAVRETEKAMRGPE